MPFARAFTYIQLCGDLFVGIPVNGIQYKYGMGSRRQLPYQLQYAGRIYFFNYTVIDKRLFRHIQLQLAKPAALFYMVQGFIDDYFLKPTMEISFRRVKGADASEHLDKSMAQDVGRLLLIGSIAHGNSHSKGIQLPVQLFLRLSVAVEAIKDDVSKILFQLPFFVVNSSCKYGRCNAPYIQFFGIVQFVVEPDIPLDQIHNGDDAVIGA